jgi:hypothetical protein
MEFGILPYQVIIPMSFLVTSKAALKGNECAKIIRRNFDSC